MIDALIVGLGNPGREYTRTRHNVGAEAVALLVERAGEKFKAGRDKALVADARLCGRRVVLAFPTTYMNDSGLAVGALMRRHKLASSETFGRVRRNSIEQTGTTVMATINETNTAKAIVSERSANS